MKLVFESAKYISITIPEIFPIINYPVVLTFSREGLGGGPSFLEI